MLGVNVGDLGYLTEFEADEAKGAIEAALNGALPVEERLMVQSRIERADGQNDGTWTGLNEAVLEKKSQGHTVRLEVTIDGSAFATYAGDGLIVSTPTGSTAYNLSARGSIVAPTHWSLQLTPVAPHMLFDRSLVLRPDTEIRIAVLGEREANLSVDGRSVAVLGNGDVLDRYALGRHRSTGDLWIWWVPPSVETKVWFEGSLMLLELSVQNLGVIESSSLVLGPGVSVLTGETGAGKTMVVQAIQLLTGGKADASMVRTGAKEATIEGRFRNVRRRRTHFATRHPLRR